MSLTLFLLLLSYPFIGIIIFYFFSKWDKKHSRILYYDSSFQGSFIWHMFIWEIMIFVDIYHVLRYNWEK